MLVAVAIRDGGIWAERFADDAAKSAAAGHGEPPQTTDDGARGIRSAGRADRRHAEVVLSGPDAERGAPVAPHELAALERAEHPRWIFDSASEAYPALLALGLRVRSCHDIALTERILLGRTGRFGLPSRTAAVLARARGEAVPDDPVEATAAPHVADIGANGRGLAPGGSAGLLGDAGRQPGLFDDVSAPRSPQLRPADLVASYRDQTARATASATGSQAATAGLAVSVGALKLLLAAESGSALVAAEMSRRGLPWDSDIHERILTDALGPRPPVGRRPATLCRLADDISAAFGFPVNPDSPVDLRDAFRRSGFSIESTRAWVLREIDHPAVAPVLRYKDLSRLYTANGWNWLDEWVVDGRLAAQFLPGAVVSGRWATRGGGGLQLPATIRAAAVARPGHLLVVADAAQLEPRILAAVSNDPALTAVSTESDLYAALAADGFGGDRRHAKLAMLGAMYGQTSGEAARLMATMRVRYPGAVACVETAARRGEAGGVVASVLGRACPPPSDGWWRAVGGADERAARRTARDRGRFTRNFVIQASAADWAAVWLTTLRLDLRREVPDAEMVLFQHDEIVIHVPAAAAERVGELTMSAARRARDLVFPGSTVQTPVRPVAVRSYAEAK